MSFTKLLLVALTLVWVCEAGAGPASVSTEGHEDPLLAQGHEDPLLTQGPEDHLLTQGHEDPLLTQGHKDPLLTQGHEDPLLTQGRINDPEDEEETYARERLLRRRWPNKTMPIILSEAFTSDESYAIHQAVDRLNNISCFRIINATDPNAYHVKVKKNERGCFANMAYVNLRKGYQVVNLQRGCLVVTGTPMHEFLHAAGIFHQQCRIDRDDYIFVQLKNTVSSYAHNFKIFRSKFPLLWLQGLPYDYHSVMHYGKKAFSSNDQNVIEVKKKDFAGSLGQRPTLSRSDIANLNRMYECWDHYLGDDIPGAIPYKEYHARFVKPDSTKVPSPSFQKWIDHIKSKT